jgi:C4-type Zn-finger protein
MAAKECPLCGEAMQIRERQVVSRIPGTPQTALMRVREWACSQCEHFEEAADDDARG